MIFKLDFTPTIYTSKSYTCNSQRKLVANFTADSGFDEELVQRTPALKRPQ